MKRQLFGSQYGFTLFELMVVITILIAFIGATNIFNTSPQTDIEKSDRMMVSVSSILRTEIQNIAIGKMPNRDGDIAWYIRIDIHTGAMITRYFTGGSQIFSQTFGSPFFDRDTKYEIKSVTWTGSSTTPTGAVGTGQLYIAGTGMTFSGVGITGSGYTILEIKVWYLSRSRKIFLDRRTGKITETVFY